jgi:threonine/homoserine/homoserine lactone efflux protein
MIDYFLFLTIVIFLYYLSYRIFTINKVEPKEKNLPNSFYTGFLLSALNPKIFTAIFIMYSQFLIPNKSNYTLVVILSLSFIFISFLS